VGMTTNVTTGGYAHHSAFTQPWRAIRIIGTLSISAKHTCIDGTAANGLNSAPTEDSEMPVKSATVSANPSSGSIRGGAVGNTTYPTRASPMPTMNMLRTQ